MELTRRDALAALASAGIVVGGGAAALARTGEEDRPAPPGPADSPLTDAAVGTLVAAAEVLYPSELEGIEGFVTEFARRRATERPDHATGVVDAVAYLDEYAESWYDRRFAALGPGTRERALDDMGLPAVEADPDGGDVERVRYYVRNDLLFALYASPTGAELVGLENPQGYPGGTASYQRGPEP